MYVCDRKIYLFVCVYVCVTERERERYLCVSVCVCDRKIYLFVCVTERERERESMCVFQLKYLFPFIF